MMTKKQVVEWKCDLCSWKETVELSAIHEPCDRPYISGRTPDDHDDLFKNKGWIRFESQKDVHRHICSSCMKHIIREFHSQPISV